MPDVSTLERFIASPQLLPWVCGSEYQIFVNASAGTSLFRIELPSLPSRVEDGLVVAGLISLQWLLSDPKQQTELRQLYVQPHSRRGGEVKLPHATLTFVKDRSGNCLPKIVCKNPTPMQAIIAPNNARVQPVLSEWSALYQTLLQSRFPQALYDRWASLSFGHPREPMTEVYWSAFCRPYQPGNSLSALGPAHLYVHMNRPDRERGENQVYELRYRILHWSST